MCGIWALLSPTTITSHGPLYEAFMKIKARGPEYSSFDLILPNVLLGFHRLAIMDISVEGNQPFHHVRPDGSYVYAVCNGEIYDYLQIKKEYQIETKSHSDCEIIIPLYEKVGADRMIRLLGSEFAFIIIDVSKDGAVRLVAGRDPLGVRPLFYALGVDNSICFSSEVKGLSSIRDKIFVFQPGTYMVCESGTITVTQYYKYEYAILDPVPQIQTIYAEIRARFTNSIRRRLMTDRPIGFLLSGGLDSSLCVGVAKQELPPHTRLSCFTLATTDDSPDLHYAKIMATDLDLDHHVIIIPPETLLKEIDQTIYAIESWDITTVRASIIQRAIMAYIASTSDIKVIIGGDCSDEVSCGYAYFHRAPTTSDARQDTIRLTKEVHLYDGLRTDRTTCFHGLEIRLPFSDPEYVDYYLSLPPSLIAPIDGVEKHTLRHSFANTNTIPDSVLFRTKEAMSDGNSGVGKSWYQYIQEYIETIVTDEEFNTHRHSFAHCPPYTKESYYYRKKFVEYFGDIVVTPHYWMPQWSGETTDPSARTLSIYKQ